MANQNSTCTETDNRIIHGTQKAAAYACMYDNFHPNFRSWLNKKVMEGWLYMQKSLDQLITDINYFSNKKMVTIWLNTHVGGRGGGYFPQ